MDLGPNPRQAASAIWDSPPIRRQWMKRWESVSDAGRGSEPTNRRMAGTWRMAGSVFPSSQYRIVAGSTRRRRSERRASVHVRAALQRTGAERSPVQPSALTCDLVFSRISVSS